MDVDRAIGKPGDRPRRAAGQAFRVLTVHADLRHQDALDTRSVWLYRAFDMDAATDKPRMAMHLMAGQRTITAADAFRHVHHKQVETVDNAGFDPRVEASVIAAIGVEVAVDGSANDPAGEERTVIDPFPSGGEMRNLIFDHDCFDAGSTNIESDRRLSLHLDRFVEGKTRCNQKRLLVVQTDMIIRRNGAATTR